MVATNRNKSVFELLPHSGGEIDACYFVITLKN